MQMIQLDCKYFQCGSMAKADYADAEKPLWSSSLKLPDVRETLLGQLFWVDLSSCLAELCYLVLKLSQDRSLFARAKAELFSDLKTVRPFIWRYSPRHGCLGHDAINELQSRLGVAASRRRNMPFKIDRSASSRREKGVYLSVSSRETSRDFASVFCSRDDVRPEGTRM